MDIQRNISDVLQLFMKARGKTLDEFAADLEISRSTLQDYLKGTGNPTMGMVEHLAQKLGVQPALLLTGLSECNRQEIALTLLSTLHSVAELPAPKKLQMAGLFSEMVQLWDMEDKMDREDEPLCPQPESPPPRS